MRNRITEVFIKMRMTEVLEFRFLLFKKTELQIKVVFVRNWNVKRDW